MESQTARCVYLPPFEVTSNIPQGIFENSFRIENELAKWATDFPMIVVGASTFAGKMWGQGRFMPALGFPTSDVTAVAMGVDTEVAQALSIAPGGWVVEDGATSTGMLSPLQSPIQGQRMREMKMAQILTTKKQLLSHRVLLHISSVFHHISQR